MSCRFIVFEGTDGSGKSTMLEEVRQHLTVKGIDACFVYDPGGTEIGQQLRKVLLNPANEAMTPLTELLLYSASRAQLVGEVIRPALEAGKVVISDRFIYSTLAYQGVSGELDDQTLRSVVNTGCGGLEADHVIYLDIPAEDGLKRAGKNPDRMEQKGVFYMEEVRQRYLGMFEAMPQSRASIIDATNSILEVKKEVLEKIDQLL